MTSTIRSPEPNANRIGVPLALPVSANRSIDRERGGNAHWQSQWHTCRLLLTVSIAVMLTGCGRESVAVVDHEHRVYVDLATQKPWMLPVQDHVPAKHPETGKETLMPGLYCPQCGRWYASPPVEVVQRTGSASRCPKGGHPMSPHGPAPQG